MDGTLIGWGGMSRPLWFDDFPTAQIPEGLRQRVKTRGGPSVAERPPDGWGVRPSSRKDDGFERYTDPASAVERVQWYTTQRCVDVAETDITPAGVTFEMVRQAVPSGGVAVIEKLPTVWERAVALDGAGLPMFTYADLNGSLPCRNEIVHPDPAVAPLVWRYRLTIEADAGFFGAQQPLVGPSAAAPTGEDVVLPWEDLRYGADSRWGDDQHVVVPGGSTLRYWITLTGPADRYRLRVGAMLSGYTQSAGRRGAAIHSTTTR